MQPKVILFFPTFVLNKSLDLENIERGPCPQGWEYYNERTRGFEREECLYKSHFRMDEYGIALNHSDAAQKCEHMGGGLLTILTPAKNEYVVNNFLWNGFYGEIYTDLVYRPSSSSWMWEQAGIPLTTNSYTNWIDDREAENMNEESCMEILPYTPKKWNPFSCNVNKFYMCEMVLPSSRGLDAVKNESPSGDFMEVEVSVDGY